METSGAVDWRAVVGVALSVCILALIVFLTLRPAMEALDPAPSQPSAR
jgi:hypothetical protein